MGLVPVLRKLTSMSWIRWCSKGFHKITVTMSDSVSALSARGPKVVQTFMTSSFQSHCSHREGSLDRGRREDGAVVLHEREAKLFPVSVLDEPIRILVPLLPCDEGVEAPGLLPNDSLHELSESGETSRNRPERGRSGVLTLETVDAPGIWETVGRGTKAVQAVERGGVPDGPRRRVLSEGETDLDQRGLHTLLGPTQFPMGYPSSR